MGRYTFFYDFLSTDIINHVEVLKAMMKLDSRDDSLLVPTLFHLARSNGKTKPMQGNCIPHSPKCKKNICRLVEVHKLMEDLRGHNFNIYECAFLDPKPTHVCTAVFSVVVQVLLFASLTYYNTEINKSKFTEDILVLIISLTTTIFFGKQAYGQMKDAHCFNAIFRIVGDQNWKHRVWRTVNMLINVVLGAQITVFNFVFIVKSADANEAILNCLALFFILELDDTLVPGWDDNRIQDEIGVNVHDYIMDERSDLTVELKTLCDEEDITRLLESDDKVYVSIPGRKEEGSSLSDSENPNETSEEDSIKVYWRQSPTEYKIFDFRVSGKDASAFRENVGAFYCIKNYTDIHD